MKHGLSEAREKTGDLWTAPAERSGDGALAEARCQQPKRNVQIPGNRHMARIPFSNTRRVIPKRCRASLVTALQKAAYESNLQLNNLALDSLTIDLGEYPCAAP